jgi:hypothetical protein
MSNQEYRGLAPSADEQAREAWRVEHTEGGFICTHCGHFVPIDEQMGTRNRNHCNACLWSRHVDESKGDRAAACGGAMKPIGLTFKHEGVSKIGEIMLIHRCERCGKLSINRIARDDPENAIMQTYQDSLRLDKVSREQLLDQGIYLANAADVEAVQTQLYGKQ